MPDAREIRIHDTRSGKLRELAPRDPGRVGIYACGPTVYSRIHIGNARPFVIFSVFKRFLAHAGYEVSLVVNVTDVNDKIYSAAEKAGEPSDEFAAPLDVGTYAVTALFPGRSIGPHSYVCCGRGCRGHLRRPLRSHQLVTV